MVLADGRAVLGVVRAGDGARARAQCAALLSVVPSQMRPHAGALAGIFLGGVGGIAGALFLSGIDRRFGAVGSMVSLVIPGVARRR